MNSKTILSDLYYTFDPQNRRIIFNTIYPKQQDIVLITNLSDTTNRIIYNFACPGESGTFANNILSLVFDTTSMSSSDKLMIIILDEDKKEKYLSEILDIVKEQNEKLSFISLLNSEDSITGEMIVSEIRKGNTSLLPIVYKNINTATETVCKIGKGHLHDIILNDPTNNQIQVIDGINSSGKVIATINPDAGQTPFQLSYHLNFEFGLTIITAGTPDITVIFR